MSGGNSENSLTGRGTPFVQSVIFWSDQDVVSQGAAGGCNPPGSAMLGSIPSASIPVPISMRQGPVINGVSVNGKPTALEAATLSSNLSAPVNCAILQK